MPTNFTITADSTPVYDTWGWADYWSCEDWIAWHKALKDKYGKSKADLTWIDAWNAQGTFEHDYNWCKYGSNFNTYVNAEKLPVTHLLSDIIAGGTKIGGNIVGGVESGTKSLFNVADLSKWLLPTVIIVAVLGAIIFFGKKYNVFSPKVAKYMALGLIVVAIITGVTFYKKNQSA